MKKVLAYKSKSEITAPIFIIILMIVLFFTLASFYAFDYTLIPWVIRIVIFSIIIIFVVSVLQLIILSRNPEIMMEHDEKTIYYYTGRDHVKTVDFKEIQNIVVRTSIWTKPFVVYTAIVIDTKDNTIYFRHIQRMKEVKEYIENLAFHTDQYEK